MRLKERAAKWIKVFIIGLGVFIGIVGIALAKVLSIMHLLTAFVVTGLRLYDVLYVMH